MTEKGMGRSCGENPKVVEEITKWVVEKANVPVYVKLTPNYGEITELAEASKRGGAIGVTATNTFPSFMDPAPDGTPWPAVGPERKVAHGGGCGDFLRPIALRKVSEIGNKKLGLSVHATGGCVSSSHALAYLRYGANAI